MNNDAHLIYEAYQASTDKEYTKNNLGVHQLANKANIRVMLQYVEDELGGSGADKFKKESLTYFLNQLLNNADKVQDAIKQVEAKMGDRERMPVPAYEGGYEEKMRDNERVPVAPQEGEEDAEDPKDSEDSEPEPETDDEREEREREEEQDDKDEMELRRRSNNSRDRYGGGG